MIQPAQLLTDNTFRDSLLALIGMPIRLRIFVDKIFMINLHLTKIMKFIDLENLELYTV